MASILNDHPLTITDKRNIEAFKHIGHKCQKIGLEFRRPHQIPWKYAMVQKWICVPCGIQFETWNWHEDLSKVKTPTEVENNGNKI